MRLFVPFFVAGLMAFPCAGAQDTSKHLDTGSQRMLASVDMAFAIKAAQGGLAEVQLGKLAADKAGNPEVKAFGQQMIDDHTRANDQLKAVAQEENMTLPTTLNAQDQATYEKLSRLSGIAFDKAYVADMVKDHQEDIREFQRESAKGKDPKMRDFASKTEPVLEGHLAKIKEVQSGMTDKSGK